MNKKRGLAYSTWVIILISLIFILLLTIIISIFIVLKGKPEVLSCSNFPSVSKCIYSQDELEFFVLSNRTNSTNLSLTVIYEKQAKEIKIPSNGSHTILYSQVLNGKPISAFVSGNIHSKNKNIFCRSHQIICTPKPGTETDQQQPLRPENITMPQNSTLRTNLTNSTNLTQQAEKLNVYCSNCLSFYDMVLISIEGNTSNAYITTSGAYYQLDKKSLQMWRRIDPATNSINNRKVATLTFENPLTNFSYLNNTIQTASVSFEFMQDSLIFLKAKNNFNYTHASTIPNPLWNKGTGANKMWTDGYGGSLHASVSGNIEATNSADSTKFILKANESSAHMAFPPKSFNFERLYGQNSRPFVYFVYTEADLNYVLANMNSIVSDKFGVFVLFGTLYTLNEQVELLDSGIMGYTFLNQSAVSNFINTAHANGFKVITYLSYPSGPRWNYPAGHPQAGKHQEINVTLSWMKSFQEENNLNGWYFDNADAGGFMQDYNFIKQVRKDIGNDNIIYHHDSVDIWGPWTVSPQLIGLRAVFINAYVQYTLTGETGEIAKFDDVNDPYLKFFSSGYGISQALGSHKRVNDGKIAVKEDEKSRIMADLHTAERSSRSLSNSWKTFKKTYDYNKQRYLSGNLEINPKWPVDSTNGWFRDPRNLIYIRHNETSFSIYWETELPSTTEVAYTNDGIWSLTGHFIETINGTLSTIHNITLNTTQDYEYRIRSRNLEEIPEEIIWGTVIRE